MNDDIMVLRALVRLSRGRKEGTEQALLERTAGDRPALRCALRRLETMGLVQRLWSGGARLTLVGLTVGVASFGPKVRRRPLRRAA